jgi:hypothetical protein
MLYIILLLSIILNILLFSMLFLKTYKLSKFKRYNKEREIYFLKREEKHLSIYRDMVKRSWSYIIKNKEKK